MSSLTNDDLLPLKDEEDHLHPPLSSSPPSFSLSSLIAPHASTTTTTTSITPPTTTFPPIQGCHKKARMRQSGQQSSQQQHQQHLPLPRSCEYRLYLLARLTCLLCGQVSNSGCATCSQYFQVSIGVCGHCFPLHCRIAVTVLPSLASSPERPDLEEEEVKQEEEEEKGREKETGKREEREVLSPCRPSSPVSWISISSTSSPTSSAFPHSFSTKNHHQTVAGETRMIREVHLPQNEQSSPDLLRKNDQKPTPPPPHLSAQQRKRPRLCQ